MNTRFLLLPAVLWAAGSLTGAEFTAADLEFFEKKIRPVLAEHCYKCHSADAVSYTHLTLPTILLV